MTNKNNDIKKIAEQNIFEWFISAYHKYSGVKLTGIVHNDKPDFQAYDSRIDQVIGIEVTGLYQNEL